MSTESAKNIHHNFLRAEFVEESEQHFTEAEHGIDAELTVWTKSFNISMAWDSADHYDESSRGTSPRILVAYEGGAWRAKVGNLITRYGLTVVTNNFVATHGEVTEDGDFSAEIRVHREKLDGDPEVVSLRNTQGSDGRGEDIGEIPIYYGE